MPGVLEPRAATALWRTVDGRNPAPPRAHPGPLRWRRISSIDRLGLVPFAGNHDVADVTSRRGTAPERASNRFQKHWAGRCKPSSVKLAALTRETCPACPESLSHEPQRHFGVLLMEELLHHLGPARAHCGGAGFLPSTVCYNNARIFKRPSFNTLEPRATHNH